MRIPAYQIYNVLQQYTDRLTGSDGTRDESGLILVVPGEETGFFSTLKRREIIEAIEQTIKKRISEVRLADRRRDLNQELPPGAGLAGADLKNGEFTPFVYNVIDKDQRKVKRTIPVTRFYEP